MLNYDIYDIIIRKLDAEDTLNIKEVNHMFYDIVKHIHLSYPENKEVLLKKFTIHIDNVIMSTLNELHLADVLKFYIVECGFTDSTICQCDTCSIIGDGWFYVCHLVIDFLPVHYIKFVNHMKDILFKYDTAKFRIETNRHRASTYDSLYNTSSPLKLKEPILRPLNTRHLKNVEHEISSRIPTYYNQLTWEHD